MEREQRPRFPVSGEKRDRFRFTLRASFPNGCPRHFDPGYRDRRNQENVEKIMSQDKQPTTITAYLRPIDRDGLLAFAKRGRDNPDQQGTNVLHTVCEGQYRTLSYVGDHDPVVVDEPLHLFGQDTAPAPGEIALSGLGGCLAVGITAVTTFRNVRLSRLELRIEGDVGNTAAWGAGGAPREPFQMGFQAIRVSVDLEGDATREELEEIVRQANYFSPVANSMRNPIPMDVSLS